MIIIKIVIQMSVFIVLCHICSHWGSLLISCGECRLSTRGLPALKPSQLTRAVSPCINCYISEPPSPLYYYHSAWLLMLILGIGINFAGILGDGGLDLTGLVGARGEVWGGSLALPRKNWIFGLKLCALVVISEWHFFVHAITSHCDASNLVLEILKHDKLWGDNLH